MFAVAVLVILDVLFYAARIGKPRGPITPALAVGGIVEYGTAAGLLIWSAVNL